MSTLIGTFACFVRGLTDTSLRIPNLVFCSSVALVPLLHLNSYSNNTLQGVDWHCSQFTHVLLLVFISSLFLQSFSPKPLYFSPLCCVAAASTYTSSSGAPAPAPAAPEEEPSSNADTMRTPSGVPASEGSEGTAGSTAGGT